MSARTPIPILVAPSRLVRPRHSFAGGFTLVEMLVVVAIIALLIAVLLPSMGRVREISRRTICASNQAQLVNGMIGYAMDDIRGILLPTNHYTNDDISSIVPKYAGDRKLAVCPSTQHTAMYLTASVGSPAFSNYHSYEMFAWIGVGKYPDGRVYAAHTPIRKNTGNPSKLWIPMDDSSGHGNNNWPDPGNNHGADGLNLGYIDGHAGFHTPAEYVRSAIDSYHPWFGNNSTTLSLAQSVLPYVQNVGGWHGVWSYEQ